jgi:putative transposase
VLRAYKYRIYPTRRLEQTLNDQLGICCELHNAALQERKGAWRSQRKRISFYDQDQQLKDIRKEREDVAAVHSQVLEMSLKRVDEAFKGFFRRVRAGKTPGYPRFKSRQRYDSLTFRQIGKALNGDKLRLPKIGLVRIKMSRPVEGGIKTLTVKREAGRWFAVFVCEVEPNPLPFSPNVIGVDVGLSAFATFSDGTAVDNPRWYRNGESKFRIAQRRVSRRRKGSNRRRKAVVLLQRAYALVREQRKDFQHNLSRRLINQNGLIAVENLNVREMARNHNLAKSINDAGWSSFLFMLAYKAESAGRVFVKVDPRGTSQTCLCGAEVRKTLAVREHVCLACGLVANRDHVSAQIILGRGLRLQDSTWAAAPCVS